MTSPASLPRRLADRPVARAHRAVNRLMHQADVGRLDVGRIMGATAAGDDDLSRRTQRQAANLEETAASMEQPASPMHRHADHARTARDVACSAAEMAGQRAQAVEQRVAAMGVIDAVPARVGNIIGVIDGIALQTRIHAPDTAAEAARAGERGCGFSGVAREVRTLAPRSAEAAREIGQLIGESVSRVRAGSGEADVAGRTLTWVLSSVDRVTDIQAGISADLQAHSAGIDQVSQTVIQLDAISRQHAQPGGPGPAVHARSRRAASLRPPPVFLHASLPNACLHN